MQDRINNLRQTLSDDEIVGVLRSEDPRFRERYDAFVDQTGDRDDFFKSKLPTYAINSFYFGDARRGGKPNNAIQESVATQMVDTPLQPKKTQAVPGVEVATLADLEDDRIFGEGSLLDRTFDVMASPFRAGLQGAANVGFALTGDEERLERGEELFTEAMEDVGDLARVAVPVATGIATAPLAATGLAGALAAVGASGAAGFAGSGFEGLTDREAGLSDESVGEVLEGAVKEGAIDAAIDGAFLGFGPAFRFVNKARHSRQLAKAQQEIGEVAGKIVQGQTKDVPKAIRALGNVDTSGVKTYQELDEVLTSKIAAIAKEQDELLDTFTDKNAISQFTESFGKGKNKVTTNVVEDAFDHLEELYDKTANPEALSRIRALRESAVDEGLNVKEINQLAREYGSDFRTFSAKGEPLTSVNAKAHENVRAGLKKASRELMPNQVSKELDKQMSDLFNTQSLTSKMVEKANSLQQKVTNRGLIEKAGRIAGRTIDKLTLRGASGFLQSFFPSNVGLKSMNSLQLQDELAKNLKRLTQLGDKLEDLEADNAAKVLTDAINQQIDDVGDDFLALPR